MDGCMYGSPGSVPMLAERCTIARRRARPAARSSASSTDCTARVRVASATTMVAAADTAAMARQSGIRRAGAGDVPPTFFVSALGHVWKLETMSDYLAEPTVTPARDRTRRGAHASRSRVMPLVPFETLPDSARAWVFGSDRPLTEEATTTLLKSVEDYLDQWK